eukprot:6195535-Pleurochrysis_carterae.AAC.1
MRSPPCEVLAVLWVEPATTGRGMRRLRKALTPFVAIARVCLSPVRRLGSIPSWSCGLPMLSATTCVRIASLSRRRGSSVACGALDAATRATDATRRAADGARARSRPPDDAQSTCCCQTRSSRRSRSPRPRSGSQTRRTNQSSCCHDGHARRRAGR